LSAHDFLAGVRTEHVLLEAHFRDAAGAPHRARAFVFGGLNCGAVCKVSCATKNPTPGSVGDTLSSHPFQLGFKEHPLPGNQAVACA